MTTRTLVLCKPDAVERGLVGEIVARLERKGMRIVAMELRTIDADLAGRHYEEHRREAVLRRARQRSSPAARSSRWSSTGDEDTWKVVRGLMGATNPREAAPGTIRGDFALETGENLVHGSDGPDVGRAGDRPLLPRVSETNRSRCRSSST